MSPPPRPADLRAALLDAALEALDRDGTLPSWRALARACGVSQTAPYRHFDDLDALRAAVAAECFRRFVALQQRRLARTSAGDDRLATAIRTYVRFAGDHPHRYALMFGSAVDFRRHPETMAVAREAFGLLVQAVQAYGIAQPERAAHVLWAAHHGLSDLIRLGLAPGGTPAAAATDMLVDMSVRWMHTLASPR
jgi:AcrR family transcriptional regulator